MYKLHRLYLTFSVLIFWNFTVFAQTNDSLNFLFLNAVFDNDIQSVKEALVNGADINFTTNENISALHYSVANVNYELTDFLIQNGADINKKDNSGYSPLSLAASLGLDSVMYILITEGADLMLQNVEGQTPLHLAVLSGNPVAADILLFYDADPDMRDNDSLTALHYAAYNGMELITEILLNRGANPGLKDKKNQNPAFYAIFVKSLPLLTLLIESGVDIWEKNSENTGILELAFQQGNEELVQYILQLMVSDSTIMFTSDQVIKSQVHSEEIWKSALKYDNIHSLNLLRKYNIKRPLVPVAGSLFGTISISGFSDFYTTAGIQLMEVNYKLMAGMGFGTRLWRNRVFMNVAPDTIYQLREYRGFFYAELAKYFTVFRNYHSGNRIDIVAGLRTPFTWANYSAMQKKDPLRITYAPFAGVEFYHKGIKLFLIYQYWDYDYLNFSKHSIMLGFGFR